MSFVRRLLARTQTLNETIPESRADPEQAQCRLRKSQVYKIAATFTQIARNSEHTVLLNRIARIQLGPTAKEKLLKQTPSGVGGFDISR